MTTDTQLLPSSHPTTEDQNELTTGSYYRSRILTANSGINRIVTLAQPLLVLASRIHSSQNLPEHELLKENIEHELKTFASRAAAHRIDTESIIVAKYFLCIAIEESLLSVAERHTSHPDKSQALFPDIDSHDRFFQILERINKDPNEHIELLELAYLCLSLGFPDKYAHDEKGEINIEQIMERLFQLIRAKRGDANEALLLTPKKITPKAKQPHFSTTTIAICSIALIAILYAGFNFMLQINTSIFPQNFSSEPTSTLTKNILSNEDL